MKCQPHQHSIQLPSGRLITTKKDCILSDEELGIAPLLAAGIPVVASMLPSLIGGLTGGKKGSKGGEIAPALGASAAFDTTMLTEILRAVSDGLNKDDIKSIVKSLLETVPPPIRNEVKAALKDVNNSNAKDKTTIESIVKNIAGQFNPQFDAALKILSAQKLQSDATNEHKIKVKDEDRWNNLNVSLVNLYKRLEALETNLISNKKRLTITAAAFGAPAKAL